MLSTFWITLIMLWVIWWWTNTTLMHYVVLHFPGEPHTTVVPYSMDHSFQYQNKNQNNLNTTAVSMYQNHGRPFRDC